MPLEAVTYISDLVATNPVNATDQVAQGDDHIRAIKTGLLNSFPGITGAMTATHTQLNQLASLAAVSVLGRSANSAGAPAAIAAAANDRILSRTADAVGFTQLTAGMFPNLVVPDAALSANVPLKNAANVFTSATQQITTAGGSPNWAVTDGTTTAKLYATGALGQVGTTSNHGFELFSNNTARLTISATGDYNFRGGLVTTSGAAADEIGYQGIPLASTQAGNYGFVLGDRNKAVRYNGAGGHTFTIPANSSVAYPIGTTLTIGNWNSSGSITIAITTDTLFLGGAGSTGSRTLANHGTATAIKITSTAWYINGTGLS